MENDLQREGSSCQILSKEALRDSRMRFKVGQLST